MKVFKLMALSLAATLLISGCNNQDNTIQLTTFTPLSGEKAPEGESIRLGANLAVKELTKKGYEITLHSIDSHMKPDALKEEKGLIIEPPKQEPQEQKIDWAEEYERNYGKKPDAFSIYGYNTVLTLIQQGGEKK